MIEEKIELNSEQEKALKKITNWFHREVESPEQQILTLRGAAGTGKTTLAQYAVELLREANQGLEIVGAAPTHNAVGVLKEKSGLDCRTIHSVLGLKLVWRESQQKLERGDRSPLLPNLIVLDEAGMVDSELRDKLLESIAGTNCKVLAMGDECQVPPVNESHSLLFNSPNQIALTKVMRQNESPMKRFIEWAREYAKNPRKGPFNPQISHRSTDFPANSAVAVAKGEPIKMALRYLRSGEFESNPDCYRIICYRNKTQQNINQLIRRLWLEERGTRNPQQLMAGEWIKTEKPIIRRSNEMEKIIAPTGYQMQVQNVKESKQAGFQCFGVSANITDINGAETKETFYVLLEREEERYQREVGKLLAIAKKFNSSKQRGMHWSNYYDLLQQFAEVDFCFAGNVHDTQGRTLKSAAIIGEDLATRLALRDNNPLRKIWEYNRLWYTAASRVSTGGVLAYTRIC